MISSTDFNQAMSAFQENLDEWQRRLLDAAASSRSVRDLPKACGITDVYEEVFALKLMGDDVFYAKLVAAANGDVFESPIVSGDYRERQLHAATRHHLPDLLKDLGLQPIARIQSEYAIDASTRVDLYVEHIDGMVSLIEVKSDRAQGGKIGRAWTLDSVIGQMLGYHKAAERNGVNAASIRMMVITDYDIPHRLSDCLDFLNKPITFVNVLARLKELEASHSS
jgi:hypothetical protein